jgi:acetylornithine deacetylase/succinyl-diaminopimelate desuccinylase
MSTIAVDQLLSAISREEIARLAWNLVSIPSHADVGNRAVAEWLSDFLQQEGCSTEIQPVEDEKHVNLLSWLPRSSNTVKLLLNGHLDTVPPSLNIQPPKILKKSLYGRGAVDMKGAVAAMSLALITIRRAGLPLAHGVMIAAVAGEEIGGIGTKVFLNTSCRPEMAIVGEPTQLRLVTAHKGIEWIELRFKGKASHASHPETGANAIIAACRAINALIGAIHAGTIPSVVPEQCTVRIDRRWLPGERIEKITEEISMIAEQAAHSVPGVRVDLIRMDETRHCRPMETPLSHPLVTTMQSVLADVGLPSDPCGVPFGTDASWLAAYGIPSVVCGPGCIAQAHSANEYIDLDQLWIAVEIYLRAILRFCVEERLQ